VVNLWGGHSGRLSLTIDRQGQIALPEAGTITIDGLTIAQAQSAIQKVLSTQFRMSMSKFRWAGSAQFACMWLATCSGLAPMTSVLCPHP